MLSQNMVLNKILETKDISLVTKNNLTEDYFFDYRAEFLFLTNHVKTYGNVPDKITFIQRFPEFELTEVNEPDSYLTEQLFSDYNQLILATGFNNIRRALEAGDVKKAQEYCAETNERQRKGAVMSCTDLFRDTSRYDHYVERTMDKSRSYMSTGLPELDKLTGGIDRENENMVIYARTGQGKTQLMMFMAAAAARQGLRVGIYEGEMTADKTGYRFDTSYGHMKNTSLNRGESFVQQEYKRYIDSLAAVDNAVYVLTPNDVPGSTVTVDTLRSFIELKALDILFIDQYDLLDDTSKARVKHERVGNIARDVKLLQVDKHIPIIAVCQMSREKNDDGSIDSTQVAGSDMISRYATILLGLEQKYDPSTQMVELDINIVKARDGGDHHRLKYEAKFNTGELKYIPSSGDGVTTEEDLQKLAASYETDFDDDFTENPFAD